MPKRDTIAANYEEGNSTQVELYDGSTIHLQKLAPDWDPRDRQAAVNRLHDSKAKGQILTGLLYIDPESRELHELMGSSLQALNAMGKAELCPGNEALEKINQSFR